MKTRDPSNDVVDKPRAGVEASDAEDYCGRVAKPEGSLTPAEVVFRKGDGYDVSVPPEVAEEQMRKAEEEWDKKHTRRRGPRRRRPEPVDVSVDLS